MSFLPTSSWITLFDVMFLLYCKSGSPYTAYCGTFELIYMISCIWTNCAVGKLFHHFFVMNHYVIDINIYNLLCLNLLISHKKTLICAPPPPNTHTCTCFFTDGGRNKNTIANKHLVWGQTGLWRGLMRVDNNIPYVSAVLLQHFSW